MKLERVLHPDLFSDADNLPDESTEKRNSVILFEECAYCEKLYVTVFTKDGTHYQYSVQPDTTLDVTAEICCNFSINDFKRYKVEQPACFEYIESNGEYETRDIIFKVWQCPECKKTYLEIANREGKRNIYLLKEGLLLHVTDKKTFNCCYCNSLCSV